MITNNIYSYYLAMIFLAYKKKKLCVSIPYNISGILLLKQLQMCGVIQFFYINPMSITKYKNKGFNTRGIVVFLKYTDGLPTFTYFKNYWNLRKKINLKAVNNVKIFSSNLNAVLLIKTKYGILTSIECYRANVGGLLVCAIYL
jgi:ribosomal protein S8